MLKFNLIAALAAAVAVAPIASANAAVTYNYAGADFTNITHDASALSHFTTSDNITGSITFNTPLAANLNFSQQAGNVANFDFNAGAFGLSTNFIASYLKTCGCSFITNNVFIDTDSSGNIKGWLISFGLGGYGSLFLEGGTEGARDQAGSYPNELGLVNASGTFTQAAAVPEASTWAMFLAGFAGIGFMARRRKTTVAFA
ncbi:MAG: PEP-CTERM sorting domain-containing protein [Sphingomonas sp.]